jgi:predicted Rdx family selenoprotein
MGSELFAVGGSHIKIILTPGQGGVFKVTLNGEVVFDKDELGRYPTLLDLKKTKAESHEHYRNRFCINVTM